MTVPDGFCVLDDLAVIRVSGTAARDFLSRQLTCDVAALSPDNALFGAWLTPKGRALSLMHLLDPGDGVIRMLVPAELADDVARRFAMFVLRDDVRLARDGEQQVLGLSGGSVARAMNHPRVRALARLPGDEPPLALALVDAGDVGDVARSLAEAGGSRLAAGQWDLLQIRAGLPWVVAATRDAFVPQMLNLDRLGAVSFSKGCYPGQEIVARTQHLGRIKRRTFIGRCSAGEPVARPGDSLHTEAGGEAVGRVVLSARHEDGQDMLAVLALDAIAATDTFRLDDPAGPRVTFRAPPYLSDSPGP